VALSFLYRALRRLLELLALRLRSERSKEIEILVLRHQLHVVRREVTRPRLEPADRALLAAFSRALPREVWRSFLFQPARCFAGTKSSSAGAGPTDGAPARAAQPQRRLGRCNRLETCS
jgi:hypothetical protein